VSDIPYEAIIAAAEESGADLIFMASHGRRGISGLLLGSETQKVLTHSKIPGAGLSLIRPSKRPESCSIRRWNIIYDEHRSLAAVVQGLRWSGNAVYRLRPVPGFWPAAGDSVLSR
jgi:hypothetical protein